MNQTPATTAYRKGEQVRYIGNTPEYGIVGKVHNAIVTGAGDRVDVCFPARGKRCGFRRLIAPENLERLSA